MTKQKIYLALRVEQYLIEPFNKLKVVCRATATELLDALINTCDVIKLKDYLNDKVKEKVVNIEGN